MSAVSYEEKGTWVYLVTSAGAYVLYLAIMLGRVASTPVDRVPYVAVLVWTIVASIAASIAGRGRWAVAGSVLKLVAYRRGL